MKKHFIEANNFGGFVTFYWSVGPRRPSEQSDAIVAGWLYV